jgi:hypothetical protein
MPRGRHRNSEHLHRLLPPLTVAGSAVVFAVGAWAVNDPVVLRVMAAEAAAAAVFGGFLLRRWDRAAGKRVSALEMARVRDEWHTEERIAELEVDLDDSRDVRGRLENKLRAKRSELARLRTEHADLLRRYATAESERARTLEDRRQLVIGAATGLRPAPVSPSAYLQANEALRNLGRNAARQQALRTVEEARRRDVKDSTDEPQGRHAADGPDSTPAAAAPALPVREHRLVPAVAAAVLPYAKPHRSASRAIGGFDFFGAQKAAADESDAAAAAAADADADADDPEGSDLADVIGDEAVAEQKVIDLTEHDETEHLEVVELRVHSSS